MPRIASSAGRARTRRPPCRPVCAICANEPRSSRGSGVKPVSAHRRARRRAASSDPPGARDDDRQPEVDERQADARADAREGGDATDLRSSQVDAGQALLADLVGEPGVEGATRERVPEAPERVRREDRPHVAEGAEEDHGDAHHGRADRRSRAAASRCRRRSPSGPRRRRSRSPSTCRRGRAAAGSCRPR